MLGGVLTQTIAIVYMTWRTDWDDQVNSQEMNWISHVTIKTSMLFNISYKTGFYSAYRRSRRLQIDWLDFT